jgi:hypothetical protein
MKEGQQNKNLEISMNSMKFQISDLDKDLVKQKNKI